MAIFNKIIEFLPQGTELMVLVKPSDDIALKFQQFLKSIKTQPLNTDKYIALIINEPLKIEFSVSNSGNLSRDLHPCKCKTNSLLLDQEFGSINNAYQQISLLLEPHRRSHGGKVYDKIYFKDDDGYWKLLDVLRDRLYQPYQAQFDEQIRVIKEKVSGYIHPIHESWQKFSFELEQKEKLINILQSQTQDLQERIDQLNNLFKRSKLAIYRDKLDEFKQRLEGDYPESNGADSWQEWIYKNNWIFGIHYGNSIGHPQIGFRSILDYLFPTPDGFVDILEIKKSTHTVIIKDKSHSGAFRWSSEVNESIGQVAYYLHEIELHQLEISNRLKKELRIELSTIKPRAFILIGKSDTWNDIEREAFRRLNHLLHGIEVITYTDLLHRAENLIKIYGDY